MEKTLQLQFLCNVINVLLKTLEKKENSEIEINLGGKMKGKVKFFDGIKEFGFIVGDDGKEYFVHKTGLKDDANIDKDDSVTFDVSGT